MRKIGLHFGGEVLEVMPIHFSSDESDIEQEILIMYREEYKYLNIRSYKGEWFPENSWPLYNFGDGDYLYISPPDRRLFRFICDTGGQELLSDDFSGEIRMLA